MQITNVVLACVEVTSFRLQWSVYAELSPVFTLAKRSFLFSRIETKRHTADYTVHAGKLRFKRRGEFFYDVRYEGRGAHKLSPGGPGETGRFGTSVHCLFHT